MNEKVHIDSMLSGLTKTQIKNAQGKSEVPMSEEEKELVRKCEHLFNFSKRHRQVEMERKAQNYSYYAGRQWNTKQPRFKPMPVTNIIYGIIEYEVPMMTENKPVMRVMTDPVDASFSEGVKRGLEYVYDDNKMQHRLPFISRDFLIFGDTFLKTYYDQSRDQIIVDEVPADYIYPEPYVDSIQKMKWFIHAEPRHVYDIAEHYDRGRYVTAENISTEILDAIEEDKTDGGMSPNESMESLQAEGGTTGRDGRSMDGRALLKEIWIDDRTLVSREIKVFDDMDNPVYETDDKGDYKHDKDGELIQKKLTIKERKYPYGRVIAWAGEVLLMDVPSPFEHGQPPFVQFHNTKLSRSFWSSGDPHHLISIQRQLNKRKSQVDFTADLMGNSIWVADSDSGVTRDQCQNRPGLVLFKRPGTEVRREPPPNIPEYMFRTIDDLKMDADFTVGMLGVVRGEKPGSVTANATIQSLLERAMVRVREKVKYLEKGIVDAADLWVSYMMQFWDRPRRFLSDDIHAGQDNLAMQGGMLQHGQMPQLGMDPQQMGMDPQQMGMGPQFGGMQGPDIHGMTEQLPGMQNMVEFSGKSLHEKPTIHVVSGSTMSASRVNRFQEAQAMLELGVIDRKEFLNLIEYPNADAVVARMERDEMQGMEREMGDKERERQLKMANYMARIKSAEIQAGSRVEMGMGQAQAKLQGIREQEMAKLLGQREGQSFDLNKLLLGGQTQRGSGKGLVGV